MIVRKRAGLKRKASVETMQTEPTIPIDIKFNNETHAAIPNVETSTTAMINSELTLEQRDSLEKICIILQV